MNAPILSVPDAYLAAVELVSAAASPDVTRKHLCTPAGTVLGEHGYVFATDGHRAHAVRCTDWHLAKRDDAPQLAHVIPANLVRIGQITLQNYDLETARQLPAKWYSQLELSSYGATLSATLTKGKGKNERKLRMLDHVKVGWLAGVKLTLRAQIGMNLRYVLDALELCGTNEVTVWKESSKSELDPLVFTPADKLPLDCERFALVMPCKL